MPSLNLLSKQYYHIKGGLVNRWELWEAVCNRLNCFHRKSPDEDGPEFVITRKVPLFWNDPFKGKAIQWTTAFGLDSETSLSNYSYPIISLCSTVPIFYPPVTINIPLKLSVFRKNARHSYIHTFICTICQGFLRFYYCKKQVSALCTKHFSRNCHGLSRRRCSLRIHDCTQIVNGLHFTCFIQQIQPNRHLRSWEHSFLFSFSSRSL